MSNKKSQLNESTIRRFMKLASISPLTETFLEKTDLDEEVTEEETVTEGEEEEEEAVTEGTEEEVEAVTENTEEEVSEGYGMPAARDEEDGLDIPVDAPEGEPADAELSPELDVEPAPAEGGEALAQEVASAVADALQDVLGVEVNVTGDAEELPGEESEMDMELPAEELPAEELPAEEEPVMEDDTQLAYNRDEMIAEVTRRVTERIKQKVRKEQIAEELATRIFNRLSDKKG